MQHLKEEDMAKDLTVILEDKPGMLAHLGEVLGRAGVNIEGICGMRFENKGVVHVLVEEGTKARKALEVNHIQVSEEQDVMVVEVEDRPGNLGNIARRLAAAAVNIHLAYLATSTRLVLGVSDLEKARSVVQPK
ncbi:MAG TPA: ACT domain-containing protein [Anaerolineaceae bacterium]|nr:ACT domain-containing protein [Anaerolineaceae bacterium]